MRKSLAIFLAAMILVPIQASAASNNLWDDARLGVEGGTIGGVSIPYGAGNNSSHHHVSSEVSDLPSVVEVYTATWCTNCVKTENALSEAVDHHADVSMIHYHRHLYETLDPFGSDSSESRWIESYGEGSIESSKTSYSSGLDRVAPSKVFDGERMYTGVSTKSNSLVTDYSTALSLGSSHAFYGNGTISLEVLKSDSGIVVNWNNSLSSSEEWSAEALLMFVEDSIHYPDGTNGQEYYRHVLHEVITLPNWDEGSLQTTPPSPWDGDDVSIVLLIDWQTIFPNETDSLPAPAVSTLLCLLAALVPSRKEGSDL